MIHRRSMDATRHDTTRLEMKLKLFIMADIKRHKTLS